MPADTATTINPPDSPDPLPKVGTWDRLTFTAAQTFCAAVAFCFSLRGLYLFGRVFGTLEWLINYRRRRRFARRLGQLWGRKLSFGERTRHSRRFFMRTRCDKIFYLLLDRLSRETIVSRYHIESPQLVDDALARGRGCFVALSHHGSQHLAAMLMALRGYRVAGVRDGNEGAMRRYVRALQEGGHPELRAIRTIFADAFPREIYRCFQDNFALGAALDVSRSRGERKRSVPVRIFGHEREFLTGTMQIALRCGATILQGFIISEPYFHYRLHLLGPLAQGGRPGDSEGSLQGIMQAYAGHIEEYVRKYPDHISRV